MKLWILGFLKDVQNQRKDVPDLSSDTKSCNVKGQLQAVACIHTTSSKSSIKKGGSSVTGIKCLQIVGFLAEVSCDVAKLDVLFMLL